MSDKFKLIVGDIERASDEIESETIDVIITDPPYPKQYLPVYIKLSTVAERILKPGGSCVVMAGQSYLPDVISALGMHLTYQWILAYLTPGGQSAQIWQRKVNTFWKPLLWFVKGKYDGSWLGDVTRSDPNNNDKRFHDWGQSESGMSDVVRRFTKPGDLVLDPFLGGGTTGVVALMMGRRFIGIDNDPESIGRSRIRLLEAVNVPIRREIGVFGFERRKVS